MTLIDTNVLSDILSGDADWLDWSAKAVAARSQAGPLFTNDIVYAELSIRMPSVAETDQYLDRMNVRTLRTPRAGLFLAARAYQRYRNSGGPRTGVLPDFFIGAHAEADGLPILTRDPRRYQTYFPSVSLIVP